MLKNTAAQRLVDRQRRVARPAARKGAARDEEAREHHHAGDGEQPEREGVQARERHVGRADHQRDHVVADAGEDRDHEEEDQERRVHGHETVERLGVDDLRSGVRELGAEDHGQQSTDEEEEEARDDVLHADDLVVGVDAEVVLPAPRAVPGVILRRRRAPDGVAGPVVEGADAGEEAHRDRDEGDGHDDVAQPDGIPALEPADERHDPDADPEEQRDHPQAAAEAGSLEPAHCWLLAHRSNSPAGITTTFERMREWPRPQSSVQMIGIRADLGRRDRELRRVRKLESPGQRVHLLAELRHPERVDDVLRAQAQVHVRPSGRRRIGCLVPAAGPFAYSNCQANC